MIMRDLPRDARTLHQVIALGSNGWTKDQLRARTRWTDERLSVALTTLRGAGLVTHLPGPAETRIVLCSR